MVELGELEANKEEFKKRNIEIVAISVDGTDDAAEVQKKFPSLKIVSDESMSAAKAFDLIHSDASPMGGDIAAPTTFIVDGKGKVRFVYRSTAVAVRISVADLLEEADKALGNS